MAKPSGLWADMLDVDKLVLINNLQEVTDPVMLANGIPSPKGVLSYEIFGTSQYDRRDRFAHIDLHGHYMQPLAALKLSSFDRKLADVLFSRGKWKLTSDGALVEDENGDSGPEFVYSIWGKVKVKEKDTVTTKEVEEFYNLDKKELFITKFPVIPPFTRDLNAQTNSSSKSTAKINSMYNSLLSYTQSLDMYTDTFTNMSRLTRGRVQQLLVDVYKHLMVEQVKGQPAKFGMMSRAMMSKSIKYAARLVISAPILNKESFDEVQVKFGYATVPLAYILSCFYPFIVFHMKQYFDAQFIGGGKVPVMGPDGNIIYTTFTESFDETYITKLIARYINSPSSRFDLVETPTDTNGNKYHMQLTGRFLKENTTFNRPATLTDILYIIADRATKDKHVYVTRYPLESSNGQFPARILISTTTRTQPVIIGETTYQFFPISSGDPSNAFVDTLQISNSMLKALGGDYDGDQTTVKPVFTRESNNDAERMINSNAYILNIEGSLMRPMEKDFVQTAYTLTNIQETGNVILKEANKVKPKYVI